MNRFINRLAQQVNIQMLVGLMWSPSAVIVKDLTANGHLDIFFISAVRSAIAFIFLMPLFWFKWETKAEEEEDTCPSPYKPLPAWFLWTVAVLGGCSLAANTFFLCWAFEHTESLMPVFMHYTGILTITLVSGKTLGYKPKPREWLVSGMTFMGVTALVYHGIAFDGSAATLASIAAGVTQFLGQLSLSWLSNQDKAIQKHTGVKSAKGANVFRIAELITIPLGLAISLITTSSYTHVDGNAMLKLILLGVFTWGIPNFFALLAVRNIEYVKVKLLWLADPIFVPLWPVLAGQDSIPEPLAWIGAFLILLALFIQRFGVLKEQRTKQKAAALRTSATGQES
jgi:drug/metabolite transporter (DMT)-like permease